MLDKHLSGVAYKAFVFGSQANCKELKRADIDIGIMPEGLITDLKLSVICADIENLPMLYKIDLVDFTNADERFKSVALNNIEAL